MEELVCDCGSKYFIETVVSKFKAGNIGPTTALRPTMPDPWMVYVCVNSKCKKVHIPELTSFSISKKDMNAYQEILSTEAGEPLQLQEEPRRMPRPGELVRK